MKKLAYTKDRNFILLFFGNLVSGVGSRIYGFGISLYLLDLTGKASVVGTYVGMWSLSIFLVGPIAATFTDRWVRKAKVMAMTDFGRGVLYGAMAIVITMLTRLNAPMDVILISVYVALVLIAFQTAFFSPAVTALIPQIVVKEERVSASSLMQVTRTIQNIAGLLLGALLYQFFGIALLMVLNAISFILSGISELFIRIPQSSLPPISISPEATEAKPTIGNIAKNVVVEIKDAVHYIFVEQKPIMMITLVIVVSSTLVGPWFSVGVPYMIKEYFTFDGLMDPNYLLATSELIEGIGVILASLVVTVIASKYKIYRLLQLGGAAFVGIGIAYFFNILSFDLSLTSPLGFIILFIGINFIAGSVNAIINAPLGASLQTYVSHDKIGKVSMLIDSIGGLLFPVTAFLAGLAIDGVSLYIPLVVMVMGMGIITLIAFSSKELRYLV